jgi:hypothetical protein
MTPYKEMNFNNSNESVSTSESQKQQQMNNSFYTKEGLDYLYFARPGTAYGA